MKNRIFSLLAALALGLSAAAFAACTYVPEEGPASGEVIIYHTNDTHGYLSGDGESVVGIDKATALPPRGRKSSASSTAKKSSAPWWARTAP